MLRSTFRPQVEALEDRAMMNASAWTMLRPPLWAPAESRSAVPPPALVRSLSDPQAFIKNQMQQARLAGVSVAVIRGDELLFSAGYGKANFARRLSMAATTPQLLASVSKTVTAVAAMQLVEAGQLDLDADLNDYLPFSVRNPNAPQTPITLRMLLTHTSSIVDNDTFSEVAYARGDSPVALGDLLRDYLTPNGRYYDADNFLPDAPGSAADYSNMGSALVGYVVEVVSGQSFDRYCHDHLFAPLGMTSTSWKLAGLNRATLAMPYEYRGGSFVAAGHYGFPDYPNGQLRSNVLDMSRFLRAFVNDGQSQGVRILSAASVAEMRRLQIPQLDSAQGLMWYYDTLNGQRVLGHDGGETGVNTLMFYRPADGVGVLVFSNTSAAGARRQDRQDAAVVAIAEKLLQLV